MEDAFVAAQSGRARITSVDIDLLLKGADILSGLAGLEAHAVADWVAANALAVEALVAPLHTLAGGRSPGEPAPSGAGMTSARLTQSHPAPDGAGSPGPLETSIGTASSGSVAIFPPVPPHEPVVIPSEPIPLTGEHSMLDLFREEVRAGLLPVAAWLANVSTPPADDLFESLRQVRGSARVMKCPPLEAAAAAVNLFLAATRDGRAAVTPDAVGWLQFAVDTLAGLISTDGETFPGWLISATEPLERATAALTHAVAAAPPAPSPRADTRGSHQSSEPVRTPEPATPATPPAPAAPGEAVVRVTAQSLNRLLGLAGESLVQARWLNLFSTSLLKLKKQHELLAGMLDGAVAAAAAGQPVGQVAQTVVETRRHAAACRQELIVQAADFDDHAARAENLNTRLYREVIASRMRPFADGAHGFARLVRDTARALGKQARLAVEGENTDVDRDILERLEAPLTHLIRNAVDHGIEPPADRTAAGKPAAGTVRLEAHHRAGMLSVIVADDGRGIDPDRIRRKVVERGLTTPDLVRQMSEAELLEFLFLPGFSTASGVTEVSGRGVGLDVVHDTARRVGGSVRISTKLGLGTSFHLHLPITLSVIRAVVVEVGGEPYAFPHTRIDRLLRIPRTSVRSLEHRQFVTVDGQNVGLVLAGQLLDVPADPPKAAELPVVLLSDPTGVYGLVVDAFRGEQDLVVRPLDPRLGKVPNLSAAAVLDDGEPVLIVDVEDLVRSMDQFIQTGSLRRCEVRELGPARKKRVLIADDSITVREVERQLLLHKGYEVAVAVDGMDAWNQVRGGRFDLLVTDVDMPRMSGLQLVQAVRAEDKLKDLPVVIVSYKEREEDRLKGLEVGANAYLTKSSFHDNRFVEAVEDLIGMA
jgi:two-component system sensor histidine kinase and response regulator WspE